MAARGRVLSLYAAAAAAVLIVVALVYAPVREGTFIWDDHALVDANAPLRKASYRELMTSAFLPETSFSDAHPPYYRPLTLVSLRLDVDRGGTPADFHTTSLVLHLAACALLMLVAIRLGAGPGAAILAALLWGLAPRLTESVAWITGRTDVLACIFGLAAILVSPDTEPTVPARGRRWARSAGAGLCLFAAVCAKEVGVAFAIAIAAAAVRGRPRPTGDERARLAVYLVGPIAAYAALRASALSGRTSPVRELGSGGRIATVLEAVGRYAEMIADATRSRTSIGLVGEVDRGRAAIGCVILLALAFYAFRLVRGRGRALHPGTQAAIVLALAALLPVLHIVPLNVSGSVTADRLLYVPLAALAIAGAIEARRLAPNHAKAAAAATLVVAVLFASATKRRAEDYTDETRFWVEAAEHAHPHNTMARRSLASIVRSEENLELSCRLYAKVAEIQSDSAEAGRPSHRRTRENLVTCWSAMGKYDDALHLAEELVRTSPESGRVHLSLGYARLHVRDFDGAKEAFDRAAALDPSVATTLEPLGLQLEMAKVEWARFNDPSQGGDRVAWAYHLARVGRRLEADAAFLAVAEDSRAPTQVRIAAVDYLTQDGTIETAERALKAKIPGIDRAPLIPRLEARRSRQLQLAPYEARIGALAR